jgi:L-ascorbate metabolism protein UlaG (beta-lactamase superfamily)
MHTEILENIFWLGHDGFMIKADDKIVTIDPYKVAMVETADIVLITHAHYDHCSPEDVEKRQNVSVRIVQSRKTDRFVQTESFESIPL